MIVRDVKLNGFNYFNNDIITSTPYGFLLKGEWILLNDIISPLSEPYITFSKGTPSLRDVENGEAVATVAGGMASSNEKVCRELWLRNLNYYNCYLISRYGNTAVIIERNENPT